MNFKEIVLRNDKNEAVECDYKIEKIKDGFHMRAQTLKTMRVKEAVLFSGEHGFSANTPFYGDGYQKLSQYKGTVESFDSFTGYTDKSHYKMPQTEGFETVYNYALLGTGENTVLIGAASCNRFR
ncbi:MAG: hypothetical protein ACI4JG_03220, partial [Acutalibacteraceae bacterium]